MLKGKKIYLRAVEKEDLRELMNWRNSPELRKNFREYKEINYDNQLKWYETKVLNDNSTIMFSIVSLSDDKLIGCCGFCYINWVNRNADISMYIGINDYYIDSEGLAEESCNLLIDYGFNETGLHKLTTEIYEFDKKKEDLYKKLNFKLDGTLRDHYYHNGRWWNSHIYSILQSDWKK